MDNFIENIAALKCRIAKGDADALDQLYRRYYVQLKLYGLQFNEKLNSYSIDDSIQELFIWIAKNHERLNEIDNLEVYLFAALKQNIYQEISRKAIRKKVKNKFINTKKLETLETSVENKFIESEEDLIRKNYIAKLLNSLPPNQKEVIYLRNYVKMSYREIAQVMDLSEQVVRNYGYRAIQKLRTLPRPTFRQSKG
jgi:RNA polymerase sigma factor (sigma-70 family)